MSEIVEVVSMEPGWFGVQVEEGDVRSSHRVRVTEGFVDDLQLADVEAAEIVRESIGFLLEREPGTAIPDEVTLDRIGRDHPDYYDELRARLGPA